MSTHSDAPACGCVRETDRTSTSDQTLYGSPAWLTALHEEARALFQDAPKAHPTFSLAEIFLDAPIEVQPQAGLPGYRMDVGSGTITFLTGVTTEETADPIVHIDWQAGTRLASVKNGPELSEASEHFTHAGKFQSHGDIRQMPDPAAGIARPDRRTNGGGITHAASRPLRVVNQNTNGANRYD